MRLLTVPEAAELLACSDQTVRREIRTGNLRAVDHRGRWRVPDDAIGEFIATLDDNQARR